MTLPDLSDLNLDAMDPSDLDDLIPALQALLNYALTKRVAMEHRAAGAIAEAQALEATCEELYATLPANWRW